MTDLLTEVDRFRAWAETYPVGSRSGEWECDYEAWQPLYGAVFDFLASRPFASWSSDETRAVLFAIARDNEMQHLAGQIREEHPLLLLPLARAALQLGEPDGRWQLAEELGWLGRRGGEEETVLLVLARDEHEYVRRKALASLARLGSPAVEEVALAAWERAVPEQQWARMMALWCLHRIASPQLERLLRAAEADPRPHLRAYAQRVRTGEVDP